MDIHQASDGSVVQTDKSLTDYDSLEALVVDVGTLVGIDAGNVLLFTEDGREIRQEVLEEAWERGGQGSHSTAQRKVIYLFNRETFWTDAEQWATDLQEDVLLPPPILRKLNYKDPPLNLPVPQITDLVHAQTPFIVAYDHLCHLQSLFKTQARALQIAYSSLSHHLDPIIREFITFSARARRELDSEDRVIRGYPVDVIMLSKVVVHEAFAKKRDKGEDESSRVKTMADWVHLKKMEQVRESCQTTFDDHSTRFDRLTNEVEELKAQSEAERVASDQKIEIVEQEFAGALDRLQIAIEQVETLVRANQSDLEKDIVELDSAMRNDLAALTSVKNDFTFHVHLHLRQVAIFQSRIAALVGPLSALDTDLRSKNAFPHLHRLHQLPFAYAASIVEVVRRKEFATFYVDWTTKLSDAINKLLSAERKRRQQHKTELQSLLPYPVASLDESMAPRLDISVVDGAESLSNLPLTRADVDREYKVGASLTEELFNWVETLETDPDVAQAVEGSDNPLPALRRAIEELVRRLDKSELDFNSAIKQTICGPNEDYEKKIADLQRNHQAHIRELEDKHDQRTRFLETRQGELQEELVRLRTDLSEEMLARQALSTELEERARHHNDRTRELEDQRDLILALQAEISQEKDRATDLGVRLQEALLDVDGLRSAEQSLVVQLQDLQEERSRTLSSLGEAQMLAQSYESQLAGLRAELDATLSQLTQAQADRDLALKNQSAEAERLMRDHIAEADGDRAVLEHQNLTLTKEIESLRKEHDDKLTTIRNAAIRREDGLKAELSFTKAQLRDMQRRETILVDELAMAKDSANALTVKESHQSEMAKDAINLASKYHETCHRLLKAINSSTTISGSTSIINTNPAPPRPKTPPTASSISSNSNDMRESVLLRSLSAASNFDLVVFADSVNKTINLVKKWSKSCRQYREQARNKITFSSFAKGDLALFLPTRNAAIKAWAAFNIGAPHNFLHVTDEMQQILKNREYYLARISRTDEATVTSETNLYGLAEGLRYYTHHVEEWTPTVMSRSNRRSISASHVPTENTLIDSTSVTGVTLSGENRPQPLRSTTDTTLSPVTPYARPSEVGSIPNPAEPNQEASGSPKFHSPQKPIVVDSPIPSTITSPPPIPPALSSLPPAQPIPTQSPQPQPHAPSPTSSSPRLSPASPRISIDLPAQRIGMVPRSSSRTILSATASPPTRDGVTFAPSSLGRPVSVASSASSHRRGTTAGVPIPSSGFGASKAALATAVIDTGDSGTSLSSISASLTDRPSSQNKSSMANLSSHPPQDDKFKPSPLGPKGSTPPKADAAGSSRLISGLSISKKNRAISGTTPPTAMDILKRFEGS